MIIYNKSDTRYQKLVGKTAISPLFDKEIPIKEHPLADPEKGTGLVMMCSAGDVTDIQFFREQNIPPKIAINKNGTMNSHATFLEGLKVKEARSKIIEELEKNNLISKKEQITHRTPISQRSGAEIEFIEMPEFYLKQLEIKEKLRSIINKINYFPKESKKILDSWVDSISIDWPISRRRFYATPIPLWYTLDKDKTKIFALPLKGKYYQPWKEPVPKDAEVFRNGELIGTVKEFPDAKWKGEERVFDTWFDSSISELNLLHHEKNPEFSRKAYPVSLRPQGKEIVRTWLYYTILRGYLETSQAPFKDVWIHQHILDNKGRKMSKSLGNIIDPQDILNNEGAEALRLWSAIEGDLSKQDIICSRERIKAEQKTLNKLLNISKFIAQFKKPKTKPVLSKTDELFINSIEELTQYCEVNYNKYDFHNPALKLRRFLWETFASHYLELIKSRAYNQDARFSKGESDSAQYTLYFILERFLTIIHPIIPQITTFISDIMKLEIKEFPISKNKNIDTSKIQKIINFNQEIWKAKKDNGISLRAPMKEIKIPSSLKDFEKDLRACHNLQ